MENSNSDWVCTIGKPTHIHGTNDNGAYSFYKQWVVDLEEKRTLLILNAKYKHKTVLAPTVVDDLENKTTRTYWDMVPDQDKAKEAFDHLTHVVSLSFNENSAP